MNEPQIKVESFLGFRIKSTGELAHIYESTCNGGFYLCTPTMGGEVFKGDSPRKMGLILRDNTPYFNTDPDRPGWGSFKGADDLEVVEVEVETRIKAAEPWKSPLQVKVHFTSDLSGEQAAELLGKPVPGYDPKRHYITGTFIHITKEVTHEVLKENEGKEVFFGCSYTSRHFVTAVPVPVRYKDVCPSTPVVLALSLNDKS